MTRYERKLFFERLVALRDAYRVETHKATGLTIEGAVAAADRMLTELQAAEVAALTRKDAKAAS
jgi:hypothetical protein